MKYNLRVLISNESKIYREIRLEALREYPEYFGSNYSEQVQLEKLYFEKIIEKSSSNGIMIGAFVNEELIAICGVSFETKLIQNAGEIIQMYVKKNYQGNKIAKELIIYIIKNIKKYKEIEMLILGVKKSNISAIKTYSNCDFILNTNIKAEEKTQYMSLLL